MSHEYDIVWIHQAHKCKKSITNMWGYLENL